MFVFPNKHYVISRVGDYGEDKTRGLQEGEQLSDCPSSTDYDQPASNSSQQISAHYLRFSIAS